MQTGGDQVSSLGTAAYPCRYPIGFQSCEEAINNRSYKDAGVDVDGAISLVEAIKPLVRTTARPGSDSEIGGFGGLFDLAAAGYDDPVLVAATDGVGTKLRLALTTGRHDTVGIDLVAMCVNDLVVQGAEPLFFLDYMAMGRLEGARAEQVIAGIAEGCRQAGCALIGGETAEMPGMYAGEDYDLAGFAVGAAERGKLITGEHIEPGDVVLGLKASGLHSNGFSLVHNVVETLGLDYGKPAAFVDTPLAEALLVPTRIYVSACLAAHGAGLVKGLAHITGGGLMDNIPRILPAGLMAHLDATTWTRPKVFGWLAEAGGIEPTEMLRTFNCGVGMVVITAEADIEEARRVLSASGETVWEIGCIQALESDGPRVVIQNVEDPWHA